MQTTHTPGKWAVSDIQECQGNYSVIDENGFTIIDAPQIVVNEKWGEMGIDHWADSPGKAFRELPEAEVKANIKLCAAAPDLLTALYGLRSAAMEAGMASKVEAALLMAENAINKATK